MSQQQIWDKIAEQWSKFRKRTPSEVESFLAGKKGKVLDLGCGSGRNIPDNPDLKYYGVDFSSEMLKIAEKDSCSKKTPAVFMKIDVGKEKLAFPSGFFDYAIFISTLHCIETPERREKALRELFQVMKKGGEVMITVWKKEAMIENSGNIDLKNAKETFVNWKKDGVNYQRYYYFYDEKELESLLKKVGFKILPLKKESEKHAEKNLVFYVRK